MVQNKKRIISLILMLTLLVSSFVIGAITASAADEAITVTGKTGKLDGSSSISWSGTNYKVVNYKNSSSTAIRTTDSDHFRVYVGNKFTVSGQNGEKISKVVITSESSYLISNSSNTYEEGWTLTINGTTATYTANNGAASVLSIIIGKQSRVTKVVITPATESACKHTNTTAIGEAKNATCTEDGITAGKKCVDCNTVIDAQETIPATGHDYYYSNCRTCGNGRPQATYSVPAGVTTEQKNRRCRK